MGNGCKMCVGFEKSLTLIWVFFTYLPNLLQSVKNILHNNTFRDIPLFLSFVFSGSVGAVDSRR